jgi:hypothetical protein
MKAIAPFTCYDLIFVFLVASLGTLVASLGIAETLIGDCDENPALSNPYISSALMAGCKR